MQAKMQSFNLPIVVFLFLVSVIVIQITRHVYKGKIFVATQNVQYVVKYGMVKWPIAWQDRIDTCFYQR